MIPTLFLVLLVVKETNSHLRPRVYRIDLDKPARQRWNDVIDDHKHLVSAINDEIKRYFKFPYATILCWLCEKLSASFPEEYVEEIKGISARSGIEYCHLVGFNILYDITNFNDLIGFAPVGCTSIVVENSEHRIIHGRNLDYFMTDLMKNLSIMVDFVRKDQVLYSGLTFAFFAGLTTGQKPNAFTISLNARRTGWYIYTLLMEVYTLFRNPIGLEIRSTLQNSSTYSSALERMKTVHLMAPSYIILAGTKKGEGAIITRDRMNAAAITVLNSAKGKWFLAQTNFDQWDKDVDGRRTAAVKHLESIGQRNINATSMLTILDTPPVHNIFTITMMSMSAADPAMFHSNTYITD